MKKGMKKVLSLFYVMAMSITLAGCSLKSNKNDKSTIEVDNYVEKYYVNQYFLVSGTKLVVKNSKNKVLEEIVVTEDMIKRIRRYSSMLIYCGRNEGFPPEDLDKGLRSLIKKWHHDLHYIPSSADGTVSGHGPYRALTHKGYFTYRKGNTKFHSERGMPSVLTYESMLRTFSNEALQPKSVLWGQHDYTLNGAQRASSFNEIIEKGYGQAKDVQEFCENAQFVNFDGYKGMFESRSINRKGLLLWMSHPAWPSMTWQTYDWYFEPNASYFGCKKGSEPLHIQWNPAENVIEVVNYSGGHQKSLIASALIMNIDGQIIWEKECEIDSNEDSTNKCIEIEFPAETSEVHFIKLYLKKDGRILSENFYINGTEYGNHQALKNIAKADVKTKFSTLPSLQYQRSSSSSYSTGRLLSS
jgi:hypothetical protein